MAEPEATLGAALVAFRAYEDAFEVRFERTPRGLFAFEVGQRGQGGQEPAGQAVLGCAGLAAAFGEAGWRNEYLRNEYLREVNGSSLCAAVEAGTALAGAARVLTGEHRPVDDVCVRHVATRFTVHVACCALQRASCTVACCTF